MPQFASEAAGAQEPTIIGVYTHKGGTGKTTHTAMMGAMLAKEGYTVIMVDADPQMSLTTQYAEDNEAGGDAASEEEEEEEEEVDDDGAAGAGPAAAAADVPLVLPHIPRDKLRKPDALRPGVFQNIVHWCSDKHNFYDALCESVKDAGFVAEPTPVNSSDYGNRLLLLPGSIDLQKFSFELERNEETMMASRHWGAARRVLVKMAKAERASFVLLDLGPHTDMLHKCLITSCDAIQPVVGACSYSCMSSYRLLRSVLPAWLKWHADFAPLHQKPAGYAFPRRFPRILPFIGYNYGVKGKGKSAAPLVNWSDSNLFDSLRMIVEGDAGDLGTQVPAEVRALYVPCRQAQNSRKTTMLVPFMRHLTGLPVAQECGRPLFDLDERNLNDYFHNSMPELDTECLEDEKLYAEQRMRALVRVLVVFHQFLASQREKEAHEEEAAQARTERKRAADGDLRGAQRRKSGRARRRANA